jgi:RNA polymerase sigma-70 factor, ECF subfamily
VPTPSGVDDLNELALAAGKGDRVALEHFVVATQRDVWLLVAHLAGVTMADELTQETYVRALPNLPSFPARGSARTWLLSIARGAVVDHIPHSTSRPRTTSAGFEDLVEFTALLDDLSQEHREALVLTQVLGLTYAEAAGICTVPVGAIRSRVARAREDLLDAQEDRAHGTG